MYNIKMELHDEFILSQESLYIYTYISKYIHTQGKRVFMKSHFYLNNNGRFQHMKSTLSFQT